MYLLAEGGASAAFGLLVGLGQRSVAGAQALTGGVIHLAAPPPLHVAIRQPGHRMRELFVPQKRLELCVQLGKLPARRKRTYKSRMADKSGEEQLIRKREGRILTKSSTMVCLVHFSRGP